MKVYDRIVIDMSSGEVLEESSFEYEGEVAWCGSSGGGGGSAGRVDYPTYMKEAQADWLAGGEPDGTGMNTLSAGNDITSLMDSLIGSSPFAGKSAYDPSTEISDMSTAIDDAEGDISVTEIDELKTYIDSIETTEGVETQLKKFNAGMRDINAVVSSSFAVGNKIVASGLEVAKMDAKGKLAELKTQVARLNKANTIDLTKTRIEQLRTSIVANSEKTNTDRKIDEKDAFWDLEVFKNGGNVLAAIEGGTVQNKDEDPNQVQSAVGGGLGGAATGASIGAKIGSGYAGYGAIIGAVVGAGAGYLTSG